MNLPRISFWSGLISGPVYVGLGLSLALATPGFELSKHALSLLTLGPLGVIQVANLWVTGLLLIIASLEWKKSAGWFIRLYGLALVLSGIFLPDPAGGFPVGIETSPTFHGVLHFVCGGVGFVFLALATIAMGLRCFREGQRGNAIFAWATGLVFLIGFGWMAGSAGSPISLLAFWVALIVTFVWIAKVQWGLRPALKPQEST